MKLHIATIATKSTWKEFLLMKFSIEAFSKEKEHLFFVSCDDFVYKKLKDEENVVPYKLIETDEANHNSISQQHQNNWMRIMLTKFDICEKAMTHQASFDEERSSVWLLDSDMLFVHPLTLLPNLFCVGSAGLCPHWTNNLTIENKFGFYNAGMVFIRSWDFLQQWKKLSQNYKQLGLYYEQQPLEFVARSHYTTNLPITYDIGWWRFNQPSTKQRLSQLTLKKGNELEHHYKNEEDEEFQTDYIYFGNKPAINFHLHLLKDKNVKKDGQELKEKVFGLMKQSNNKVYHKILEKYEELSQ